MFRKSIRAALTLYYGLATLCSKKKKGAGKNETDIWTSGGVAGK